MRIIEPHLKYARICPYGAQKINLIFKSLSAMRFMIQIQALEATGHTVQVEATVGFLKL
jgi:hypothetical protein